MGQTFLPGLQQLLLKIFDLGLETMVFAQQQIAQQQNGAKHPNL
jgi:hypothetical protein